MLKLPKDDEERTCLSFHLFPSESKLAYYLEASSGAWYQLKPLLNLMIKTNTLSSTFGPSAYMMKFPEKTKRIVSKGFTPTIELVASAWGTI